MELLAPDLSIVEQALDEQYLDSFIKSAWPVIEPKTPLIWGWHLDAICEHLQAVTDGHIKQLLINIPPRHMKSLAVSVFWPMWTWIRTPEFRWLYSSYSQELSTRDNLKCRRLIQSQWFRNRWSDRFFLTGDQNQKTRFENNETGYRIATSVAGMVTGEGGDGVVVDDPHNVKETESQAKRETCLMWWDESMSTRLNDPNTGFKVIIMQRVHEDDLSGHVLEQGGYEHLCLPARYEGSNRCKTSIPLGNPFKDPRKEDGEPLWPELYHDEVLARLESTMTEYAVAGQLQQRPAPRGGGMFKVVDFKIIKEKPQPNKILRSVRYWDKAGTDDGGMYTCGVLMHKLKSGRFVIADLIRGQWSAGKRESIIRNTTIQDGPNVTVYVEQEPGSGGKESAENTISNNAGYNIYADRVTGDKVTRAEPYGAQVEGHNVDIVQADWVKGFKRRHAVFPMGKYADDVDASSGAFNKLNTPHKRAGVWGSRKKRRNKIKRIKK
jgi:predicted phage terminase large subunit-like protein